MDNVDKVKREVEEFSPEELVRFRQWFVAFDGEAWDRQFEADAKAGKLDALAEGALRDHANGKSTKL